MLLLRAGCICVLRVWVFIWTLGHSGAYNGWFSSLSFVAFRKVCNDFKLNAVSYVKFIGYLSASVIGGSQVYWLPLGLRVLDWQNPVSAEVAEDRHVFNLAVEAYPLSRLPSWDRYVLKLSDRQLAMET
jgi:hypothetical protein